MLKLPHIAARVFDAPLTIRRGKLETVLAVLAPHLGLAAPPAPAAAAEDKQERRPYAVTSAGVAVIDVMGTLVQRSSGLDAFSGLTSYAQLSDEFAQALADPLVRGIVLHVDSNGGEAAGCFDFADEIFAGRGIKPIYASVDEVAFSAAYAIASAADKVYVPRTGGVGSIGVITVHLDVSERDEKDGEKWTYITAGAKKGQFSAHAPLSDEARADLQRQVDQVYGVFVDSVARARSLSPDAVRATEADLYFGQEAVSAGLADGIARFKDVLAMMTEALASPATAAASGAQDDGEGAEEDDDEEEESAAVDEEDDDEEGEGATAATAAFGALRRRDFAATGPLLRPASVDDAERTVEMVLASETPVRCYDYDRMRYYDEVLEISESAIRLGRFNAGASLLASHDRWRLSNVLGAIVPGTARIDRSSGAPLLVARVRFSERVEVEQIFRDVRAGVIRHGSTGFRVHRHRIDETTSPPVYRAIDWEPFEASVVSVPADPKTGFRSFASHRAPPASHERGTMNNATAPGGKPGTDTADIAAIQAAARKEENERIRGITDVARRLGIDAAFAQQHVDGGTALDMFRGLAIDKRAELDTAHNIDAGNSGATEIIRAPRPSDRRFKTVEMKPGQMAARLIRIYAAAKGNPDRALKLARSNDWDDGHTDITVRALIAGAGGAGGFLVPEEYSMEVIELLRHRAVVRKLGARQLPMPGGNLSVPRLNAGATAAYVGEAVASNASQESIGQLRFAAKKLMAQVPISNDLIKFASPQADLVVRDDMVAQIAVAEDAAFIRGNGTQFSPKGIRNWLASSNVLTTAGTTLANITADLEGCENALEQNDVRMIQPGWIFNPRTKNTIKYVQATTGQFVYRDEMDEGELLGFPFEFTNNIPANLGGGSQTEFYLVDFADAVIADVPGLEIDISSEAAYVDSTGTLQAAFSQDVTVIKAIERHDFGMRHDVSAAVMTAVAY
jgi:HK97 family phage major capsid protein